MKVFASLMALLLPALGFAQQDAVIRLPDALGPDRDLTLHLRLGDRSVVGGFGTGLNARSHTLDTGGLRFDGARLAGDVRVTVNPDPWLPADGNPIEISVGLDLSATHGELAGIWSAPDRPPAPAAGRLQAAAPDDAMLRVGIRIPGALRRVYAMRGPSYRYALDMDLRAGLRDGTADLSRITLESSVPDYRRYTARVQSSDLRLRDGRLAGAVTALIDHGGQAGGRGVRPPREELHAFDLDLWLIGGRIGGTCRIRVADAEAVEHVVGVFAPDGRPDPGASFAWLRLHHAIQDRHSIRLELSLNRDRRIHGFAWVPSENHQPHSVDASRLRLTSDGRLAGPVRVTVVPDVYRRGEPFTVDAELDVAIDSPDIRGAFTGEDRGVATRGEVTGEIRARPHPVARDLRDLSGCVLGLGYSLVTGDRPRQAGAADNHAEIHLDLREGEVIGARLIRPSDGTELQAEFEPVSLAFDGDRLTGTVTFQFQDQTARPGRYQFRIEATVEENRLRGYWRGELEGAPILTRSSKLSGRLIAP